MNEAQNRTLSEQGQIILRRYHALHLTLRQHNLKSLSEDQAVEVEATKDRFIIWSSNIGLFNPAHSSLDYRLRDNDQIHSFTSSLLEALGNTVQRIDDIECGKRLPFELIDSDEDDEETSDNHATDTLLDDTSSLNSDNDIVIGGVTSEAGDPETECSLLLRDTNSIIDQLSGLTLQIRNPASRKVPAIQKIDLYSHISPEFKDSFIKLKEEREYNGLVDLFRQWRKESSEEDNANENSVELLSNEDECLIRRFLNGNLVRRRRFHYWRRYKLKSQKFTRHAIPRLDQSSKIVPVRPDITISHSVDQSTIRQTIISHQLSSKLSSELPIPKQFALKTPTSSKSSRAATVSVRGPDGLVVHWPVPPLNAKQKMVDFECPYCFFLCPYRATKESAWRDHLRYDLQPYQCTYPDCDDANEMFYDYQAWNMHEQRMHRRNWDCNLCDGCTFPEQVLYEEHVRSKHADQALKLLTPELVTARETTPKTSSRPCPICLQTFPYTHELQRHVARHLEGIALIALPPEEDIESDSEKNSSIKSHVAERRQRLPALSTTNDFRDDLGEPPSFPENEVDSTYLPAATTPLTRRSLQDIARRVPEFVGAEGDNKKDYETGEGTSVLAWLNEVMADDYLVKHQPGFDSSSVHEGKRNDEEELFVELDSFQAQSQVSDLADLDRRALYDRLGAFDYSAYQKDLISRREEGTGHLFLGSPQFQRWHNTSMATRYSQILSCLGPPGSGKTFITSLVVNHLCAMYQSNRNVAFAYIYFDVSLRNGQTPLDVLKSLLQQLLQSLPSLPRRIIRALRISIVEGLKQKPEVDVVVEALRSLVVVCRQTFIVFDSLEEYDPLGASKILETISKLQTWTEVRLFITSRANYDEVRDSSSVHISDWQEADMNRYAMNRMAAIHVIVMPKSVKEKIATEVVSLAHGSFLFVRLAMESLRLKSLAGESIFSNFLKNLPQNLEETHHELMTNISTFSNHSLGYLYPIQPIVKFVTNARRPLRQREIEDALNDGQIGPTASMYNIRLISGGLLDVDKASSIVYFTHRTTTEYFERTASSWFPDAERTIAKTCINYLLSDRFISGKCGSRKGIMARLKRHPFYEYAAKNWGHHAREHYKELWHLILILLRSKAKLDAATEVMLVDDVADYAAWWMPALHVAAYFGLAEAIPVLSELGYHPNAVDFKGWSPLFWAAKNGHEAAIKLLVTCGASLEQKDSEGWTPLLHAVASGQAQAADALLKSGADLEAKGPLQMTPLLIVANSGDDTTAKLLLFYGANVNSETVGGQTGLSLAAKNGLEKIVTSLLEAGAEKEVMDKMGRTALWWAVFGRHGSVVRLLLEAGASIEAGNERWNIEPLLSRAATDGSADIVRLLLEAGADKEARDNWGETPLTLAASRGHEAVVRLLLEAGASTEARNTTGDTPLSRAASEGHTGTVRILLEAGADVEAQTLDERTPLISAAANGGHEIVTLLLDAGADPEAQEDDGSTALSKAILARDIEIVKLLLDKGADIEARDREQRTPLFSAARMGYYEGAWYLIERGAQVNVKDSEGHTPLSIAVHYKCNKVADLLIKHGAVAEMEDVDRGSPVSFKLSLAPRRPY